MGTAKKTDNTFLTTKLDLRRYMIRKYHGSDGLVVLDCCAGDGLLWLRLRNEFAVASYWAIDRKRRPGRMAMDSVRLLEQRGWTANVIDIDTYGSPWKHWGALLPNVREPVTVFLTIGQVQIGTDFLVSKWLGLGELSPPAALRFRVQGMGLRYCLAQALTAGLRIVEAVEALPGAWARYIGVRVEPVASSTTARSSKRTRRSSARVTARP